MKKTHYSYEDFRFDIDELFTSFEDEKFEAIVAVARGGLTLGHFLASRLGIRRFYSIGSLSYDKEKKLQSLELGELPELGSFHKILLVDDIVDSGDTMIAITQAIQEKYQNLEVKTATLFYKKTASFTPDYKVREAHEWIEFFWEEDLG